MQQLLQFINNHLLLNLAWLLLFIMVVIIWVKNSLSDVAVVSSQEAIQLINRAEAIVWDVRPKHSFDKGHIAESRHVSAEAIKANSLGPLAQYKVRPLVLVSDDGLQAMTLAKILHQQGFRHLSVLRDGLLGWNSDQLPLTTGSGSASQRLVNIEIYTRAACPYCSRAKALFAQHGAECKEIAIDHDEHKQQEMVARSGRTSVPQIFIDGEHIGGCDDLLALDAQQKLAALLR
jgi:GrxC family glutaredoxin